MKFSFIDVNRAEFPVARFCEVLEVSPSGYFAWKNPACERQRKDMVFLAHIRERLMEARARVADLIEDGIFPHATGLPG